MMPLLHRFIADEKAAILPMAALLIPVILGMAGLGVDASNWMMTQRNLQNAADAAAISAAWEIANGYDFNYETAALNEAQNNGYDPDEEGSSLEVVHIVDEDGSEQVTANLSMKGELWLSSLLFQLYRNKGQDKPDPYQPNGCQNILRRPDHQQQCNCPP